MSKSFRVLKAVSIGAASVAVSLAALYQFAGLRIVMNGGGMPRLAFTSSASAQADTIDRHRESQRESQSANSATPTSLAPAAPMAVAVTPTAPTPTARVIATPDWSSFRGPTRDGLYSTRPILTAWPNGELKPLWKQPIGGGYASFVTARVDGRDLAFTIEQRGDQEVAAAYEVVSGKERWISKWSASFQEFMGGDGPRATPTYFDGYIYAQGAQGELRALDAATGQTIWRTNILDDAGAKNLQYGMAGAPLIVDDTVVVLPGGSNSKSVMAYSHRTGARAWSAQNDRQAYSSPMLVTLNGVRQILLVSASRIMGLTPDKGALLWEYPWVTMYDVNAAQPVVIGSNRVFMSSSYDKGGAVIEITENSGRTFVREVWKNNRMKNRFSTSVLFDGHLYGLDENILACLDVETGALKWKGGRYRYRQIALASGHIIVLTEDGELALVRATPDKHDELARFPVLDGKTWNHPAFSDGRLLVRNLKEMAAFDLRR